MSSIKSKESAISRSKQTLNQHPIYLDTETTGLGPNDEIVDLAIVDENGKVLFDSLVKPTIPIPPGATAVHQITDEMVSDAPTWPDIWPEINSLLQGKVLGIYNADYDLRLMRQTHKKYGLEWVQPYEDVFCIMKIYAAYYGDWNEYRQSFRWQKLENAARQCRIRLKNTHRAKDDTALSRAIHLHIAGQ